MTCKWTYLAHEAAEGRSGWSESFFEGVGLGDLVTEGYARIGTDVQPMGSPIEGGLTERAAAELGLAPERRSEFRSLTPMPAVSARSG